jgi:hypothetical protein
MLVTQSDWVLLIHLLDPVCSAAVKNVPEFKIEPEIAIELLMASNFLDC